MSSSSSLIDSESGITDVLKGISSACSRTTSGGSTPLLYIDFEGNNLSREGTLSLIQIHIPLAETVKTFVIDVTVLGEKAFSTSVPISEAPDLAARMQQSRPVTLEDVLASKKLAKVFWDVRNDSDALFNLFDVEMDGVIDLQLFENATRPGRRRTVNGLARVIKTDARLDAKSIHTWTKTKDDGRLLFMKSSGGFGAFDQRPLDPLLVQYAVNDVIYLPRLWQIYDAKLTAVWRARIEKETTKRLALAKQVEYWDQDGNGALSPFAAIP